MAASVPSGAHRRPGDMETPELMTAYRHAYALAELRPSAQLAKALAGWMFTARSTLEKRGQADPKGAKRDGTPDGT